MTKNTLKRITAYWLINHVFAGTWCFAQKRWLLNALGHRIGAGTKIVGPLFCTGNLVTGKECWIGHNFTIHGNGTVILGDRCDIGPEVMFLTGSHEIGTPQRRAGTGQTHTIRIEEGCWIGARSTFLNEITVGRGSVIAACACVAKNVSPDALAGGVPAREIRML